MSRPVKYHNGVIRTTITLPKHIYDAIANHPNRSAYIQKLIEFDLNMHESEQIDARLSELNDAVLSLEKDKLSLIKEKNALEAQKNALQRMKDNSLNARLKIVETFVSKRATETDIRGWFESRTDKLKECGFSTPKEATEWVKRKMAG
jgi:hypothetical protein